MIRARLGAKTGQDLLDEGRTVGLVAQGHAVAHGHAVFEPAAGEGQPPAGEGGACALRIVERRRAFCSEPS